MVMQANPYVPKRLGRCSGNKNGYSMAMAVNIMAGHLTIEFIVSASSCLSVCAAATQHVRWEREKTGMIVVEAKQLARHRSSSDPCSGRETRLFPTLEMRLGR